MSPHAWVEGLRQSLALQADAALAANMQAYMKSAMPFLGLRAPQRRASVKQYAAAQPLTDNAALCSAVLQLWRQSTHREQCYAALDLLRLPRHRRWADLQWLPVLEEFIDTGPWWDFNDEISGQALALLLQRHPEHLKPLMRRWARGPKLWFRRAAMLGQRSLDDSVFDARLLYDCILPSLPPDPLATEFFIRKGMGWALRERSYSAPAEVEAFCAEYRPSLSGLTLREALKVVKRREPK